jgi:hypothetical protein
MQGGEPLKCKEFREEGQTERGVEPKWKEGTAKLPHPSHGI